MEIENKIVKLISNGYTCDVDNGIIYNPKGIIVNTNGVKSVIGYYKIICVWDNINKVRRLVYHHQFIFYVKNGYVPKCIDHKDRDPSNNRIDNLRDVTHQQNSYNRGSKGYYFDKDRKKYRTGIYVNGKTIGRTYYNTEQEAIDGYNKLKLLYHKI